MIKSVRIRNFRSIEELTFRPLESGITGILGATGAGKSSILSAVLFALFGVRPDSVNVKELRRDGSSTSDECSVSVLFTNAGQEVEIIREIKGSAARVVANIYVDGVEHTVTSVGEAERWIRERLGIDATGFMTAFVVRQKELEDIVSALPSKRKAQIEKLAGIDTLGEALQKARKEENLSKELLKNLPGTKDEVDQAEGRLNAHQKNNETFMEAYYVAENKVSTLEERLNALSDEMRGLEGQSRKIQETTNNIANIKDLISTNETLLKSVMYVKDVDDSFDLEAMRAEHKRMYTEVNSLRGELSDTELQQRNHEQEVLSLKQQIEGFPAVSEELLSVSEEELKERVLSIETKKADTLQRQHQAKARKADFEESIEQLQHSDDCPTCYTHLDNKQTLLDSLNSSVAALEKDIAGSVEELSALAEAHMEASKAISDRSIAANEKLRQESIQERYRQVLEAGFDDSKIDELKKSISALEKAMEKSAEQGTKAKNIENDRKVFTETSSALSTQQQRLTEAEILLSQLLKTYDENRRNALNTEYQRVSNEHRVAKQNFSQFSIKRQEQDKQVAIAESYLKNVSGQWKAKKELLEKAEKQALTRELIEKYRKDTIASLTPELSENASMLISEMTSGAFISVTVGEDFSISVETKEGRTRKVSELSGGEEAAVALSLRLAIAALITGDNQELAWLDEVLTAQDAERRASMLSTIRDLSIKQIIMINHTAEAADIADRIVMLEHGAIVSSSDNAETVYEDPGSNDYSSDDWGSLSED